ncbi:MAG: hypothetical protein ACD_28C00410G0007 [uncultured bacterium]|nr:MAG: hypothetical protein ACD_28C00410G0007 [uncultured bacterium]KKT76957.1 MAG: hypothetical protein UW70_C0007G0014 [Candidatus Peregrinibacteria bacterium GW2011_GWA2_44_7]
MGHNETQLEHDTASNGAVPSYRELVERSGFNERIEGIILEAAQESRALKAAKEIVKKLTEDLSVLKAVEVEIVEQIETELLEAMRKKRSYVYRKAINDDDGYVEEDAQGKVVRFNMKVAGGEIVVLMDLKHLPLMQDTFYCAMDIFYRKEGEVKFKYGISNHDLSFFEAKMTIDSCIQELAQETGS